MPEAGGGEPGRVLVTGAAGFIGACAVRRLAGRGVDVHAAVRQGSDLWRLQGLDVPLHVVDLSTEDAARRALLEIRPAIVIHLAAHGGYHWQEDVRAIVEADILASYCLFRAAAEAGAELVVNAGSSSEYGYRDEPMREHDRLEPNSVYAVAKAAQTHLCRLVALGADRPMVTFRLFSVYGPWEEPRRLVPTAIRRVLAGEPLEMAAPDTARDFVFVEDALDALTAFERLKHCRGDVLNLGSGVETTLREFVAALEVALGRAPAVRWGAGPSRAWDTKHWRADLTRTRRALDWTPRHDLVAGLRETARWMEGREMRGSA